MAHTRMTFAGGAETRDRGNFPRNRARSTAATDGTLLAKRTAMRLAPLAARLAAVFLVAGAASVASLSGCAATGGGTPGTAQGDELVGADDSGDARAAESVLGSVPVGSQLKATTGVNLRSAASTSAKIYHVVPTGALVEVVSSVPQNGFYQVKHLGVTGWSFGAYYDKVSSSGGSTGGGSTGGGSTGGGSTGGGTSTGRDLAIARAKEGVGFSYWWGHGRWQASGPTSSNKGSCSGSCPSCSHGGSYGADCSGYVGKIWAVGQSADVSVDAHPYSTGSFINDTSQWHTVSRGSVQKGDALVHNESGSGHIFLYESGDGWGSMWTYEAKGCSYGIVHDIRTATSNYHAISHY